MLNMFFEEKGSELIEVLCEFEENKKELEKFNLEFSVLKEMFVLKDNEFIELKLWLNDFNLEKEIMGEFVGEFSEKI